MSKQEKHTLSEVSGSVTGFEEIAVAQRFGNLYALFETAPMTAVRALIFVENKRGGMNDAAAYEAAMTLTALATNDFFEPDPVEIDEDSPDTETGKGSTPSE